MKILCRLRGHRWNERGWCGRCGASNPLRIIRPGTDTLNDWAYDGCADCIVGEPHVCTQFEKRVAPIFKAQDGALTECDGWQIGARLRPSDKRGEASS